MAAVTSSDASDTEWSSGITLSASSSRSRALASTVSSDTATPKFSVTTSRAGAFAKTFTENGSRSCTRSSSSPLSGSRTNATLRGVDPRSEMLPRGKELLLARRGATERLELPLTERARVAALTSVWRWPMDTPTSSTDSSSERTPVTDLLAIRSTLPRTDVLNVHHVSLSGCKAHPTAIPHSNSA